MVVDTTVKACQLVTLLTFVCLATSRIAAKVPARERMA